MENKLKTKLITDAVVEPLTYSDMEYHLRLTTASGVLSDETTYIEGLIVTARKHVEKQLGRKFITQVYDVFFDSFPSKDYIKLPFGELITVSGVFYTDSTETETELSSDNYLVDTDSVPGRVVLAYGESWPSFTASPKNPVRVRITTGYGSAASNVPWPIKSAMKLFTADMYELREVTIVGTIKSTVDTCERLLWPYRMWL